MRPLRRPAQGFTLVELLVAMALGLTVIALASSGLLLARQGMQLVDQSTQLQDRERLARDVITRLLRQASAGLNGDQPALYGWDNAAYRKPETLDFLSIHKIHNGSRPGHCGKVRDSSCLNGSDILAVRLPSGSALSLCGGTSAPAHPVNFLYLARSSTGEPGLYCAYPSANDWVSAPLIDGVESLQFLFGLQSEDAGSSHIVQWKHAGELEISGDAAATRLNWQRVHAVQVALVLRSADGVAAPGPTVLHPWGASHAEITLTDAGASLELAADRRLRHMVQWSVHLPAAKAPS